jgi:hypothetical protein
MRIKGGSTSPKAMAKQIAEGANTQAAEPQRRFANALRTTRSTFAHFQRRA